MPRFRQTVGDSLDHTRRYNWEIGVSLLDPLRVIVKIRPVHGYNPMIVYLADDEALMIAKAIHDQVLRRRAGELDER